MDLRQLKYFSRIVELESITAAADALHIAQPSLSQHVANLENEFSTKLLVRGPGGVRPTETGRLLYRHAKMVLRQLEEARAAVENGRDMPAGHVTFGLPTSTSRLIAVPLIDAVAQTYPEVKLELVEGSNADLADAVASQRLDLALAMDVVQRPARMQTTLVLEESLLVVGRPLPGGTITLAGLAGLPLVLPSLPNSIRVLTERAFNEGGLAFNLVAQTSAVSILLTLVRAGRGWTLLPASALGGADEPANGVVGTPLSDWAFTRKASLCLSVSAQQSLTCLAIHALVRTLLRDMIADGRWRGVRSLDD